MHVGGHLLELRGQAVALDGRSLALPASQLAVLRMLAERPGRVRSRAELRGALPSGTRADEHAVEVPGRD